jgi:transposase
VNSESDSPTVPFPLNSDTDALKLKAIELYQSGNHGFASIARQLCRSRATVTSWIQAWQQGGTEALLARPYRQRSEPYRFSPEARAELLERARRGEFATCRQAWRWIRFDRGLDICYLTVWRFLADQGLFEGVVKHARHLTQPVPPPAESAATA